METELTLFLDMLGKASGIGLVLAPTIFGFMVWNKLNVKSNPKIKSLEAADKTIVESTNEALAIILDRMDAIEHTISDLDIERKPISGFKADK